MAKRKFTANPFNVLLVIVGVVFAVTALAFGMMSFLAIDPQLSQQHTGESHLLWTWLSDYGDELMYAELGLLAICTIGTIMYDMRTESNSEEP